VAQWYYSRLSVWLPQFDDDGVDPVLLMFYSNENIFGPKA